MQLRLYYKYSDFLKQKYGEKAYKLPVNLNITCPNRDGTIGTGGCYFCSEKGAGFESLSNRLSVSDQLKKNMTYIGERYHAKKYIAYFQNYTNTYMPFDDFKQYMKEACQEGVVEIVISTRPDCISSEYLEFLKELSLLHKVNITFELGLQTTNDESLIKINRGHSVADFIDAVKRIQEYPFDICTHFILNLPWDTQEDVREMALLINTLNIDQVKLHSLYIAKNTVFESMFMNGDITLCTLDDYIDRVILFLEHLNEDVVIQRLVGRAPKEDTVFCNWGTSWWKIRDDIEEKMTRLETYQGKRITKTTI